VKRKKEIVMAAENDSKAEKRNYLSSSASSPVSGSANSLKKSWFSVSSLKRSLIVSIGTSSIGKGTILANLPYETQNLVRALITLTGVVRGAECASKLEDNIFRLLCELASAHSSKEISYKEFLIADPCLREAFEILMKLFHYYDNNPRNINLRPGFIKVQELLFLVGELLTEILKCRLNWEGEALERLNTILEQCGNSEFLEACWNDLSLTDPLFDLYDSMQKYNAFHYYSKSTGKRSEAPLELQQRMEVILNRTISRMAEKPSLSDSSET